MYKFMCTIYHMITDTAPERFPIRELARRTGVNTSTLRAWENRHNLLNPARTDSGHRLYNDDDVLRVRRLQQLLAQGLALNEIGGLLDGRQSGPARNNPSIKSSWQVYLNESLRALEDFNDESLNNLYYEACALYPIDIVTRNLLLPILDLLGERWDHRPSGIAEEHFYSAWLRNKLGARLHHNQGPRRGSPVILACLPGEQHEIGLLLFALSALEQGMRVIYLGADMPIRQIIHVSRATHAQGIVLAGQVTDTLATLGADIAWLVAQSGIPVFLGSHVTTRLAAEFASTGAVPLGDDIETGLRILSARLTGQGKRPRT